MSEYIRSVDYTTELKTGSHWSLRVRRGTIMRLTDVLGGANVGMLFYNPDDLLERYNAPDTMKCQHTFKLTKGNCLYSDMGRIFASIVDDNLGWHETVSGNSHSALIEARWGGLSRVCSPSDPERAPRGAPALLLRLLPLPSPHLGAVLPACRSLASLSWSA